MFYIYIYYIKEVLKTKASEIEVLLAFKYSSFLIKRLRAKQNRSFLPF
jgi:hypothetical protein